MDMKHKAILIPILLLVVLVAWLLIAPPRWWLNLTKPIDLTDPIASGAQLVDRYECRKCHRIGDSGALKAPELTSVAQRLDEKTLRTWLENPQAIKGNTAMPNFRLSDSEIEALLAYLQTQ
ncbi:MAG: cytochrome c [Chloroflexi bacterium]|nr:cytochrome c [Chloroflexota bacterium]